MGAVCHTLNPRLTAAQIGAMLVQSEAGILLVSADLLPLAEAAARNVGTVRRILLLDADADESDAGEGEGRSSICFSAATSVSIVAAGAFCTKMSPLLPLWNARSEEHTSELQSLMRISYAVF